MCSRRLLTVLTIGGTDVRGVTGIQADLSTFNALGMWGVSAVTCITSREPEKQLGVYPIAPILVANQIHAAGESFQIVAAKTGLLAMKDIIERVAEGDINEGIPVLVVDPSIWGEDGTRLLPDDAVDTLCNKLFSQARVITPNLPEAALLCGRKIDCVTEMRLAAQEIGCRYDVACLIKGTGLPIGEVVNVLFDGGNEYVYHFPRVEARDRHGAGSAFSAALTAFLGQGKLLNDAALMAGEFVRKAIDNELEAGLIHPLDFSSATQIDDPEN